MAVPMVKLCVISAQTASKALRRFKIEFFMSLLGVGIPTSVGSLTPMLCKGVQSVKRGISLTGSKTVHADSWMDQADTSAHEIL